MFDLLQWFDPIKWLDDLYTTARNGRGVLITWDANCHTGAEVEAFLRSWGIRVYGRKYRTSTDPTCGCHVRKRQAAFADGLLRGHGYAVLSPPLSKPIRPNRQWGVSAPSQGLGSMVGDLFGVMDGVNRRRRQRR